MGLLLVQVESNLLPALTSAPVGKPPPGKDGDISTFSLPPGGYLWRLQDRAEMRRQGRKSLIWLGRFHLKLIYI